MNDAFCNKAHARKTAKAMRRTLVSETAATKLIAHFPQDMPQRIVGGFAPLADEIDLWPLLKHLHTQGRRIGLPITPVTPAPLRFRHWTPDSIMETDRYGVSYPIEGEQLIPQLILVPLLAFSNRGDRLGYGGGYYDRTLQNLRQAGEVFACGVAYAGQEMAELPTDEHDERLDGVLTETGFKAFT